MAIVVTYLYPVSGLVPPTALQSADRVTAEITALNDPAEDCDVIHNFELSAGDLARGKPQVILIPREQFPAQASGWAVTAYDANSITLSKGAGLWSGWPKDPQIRVEIHRPHSVDVIHNFGLTAGEIAAGKPIVILTPLLQAVALVSGWAVTAYATNSITLTKSTNAVSQSDDPQLRVEIQRPHSIIGTKLVA